MPIGVPRKAETAPKGGLECSFRNMADETGIKYILSMGDFNTCFWMKHLSFVLSPQPGGLP